MLRSLGRLTYSPKARCLCIEVEIEIAGACGAILGAGLAIRNRNARLVDIIKSSTTSATSLSMLMVSFCCTYG